jgi:hypothetical protein
MEKKKTSETEELYGELGEAFNFTQGDLEANRAGKLSKRQEEQIGANVVVAVMFLVFLPSFMTFIVIIFSIFTLYSYFTSGNIGLFLPGNCYFIFLITPIAVLWYYKKSGVRDAWTDANQPTVISLDDRRYRELTAVKKSFGLSAAQKELLASHHNLQFYVLPKSNYVVSVEEFSLKDKRNAKEENRD